jgi:hypothetical protein
MYYDFVEDIISHLCQQFVLLAVQLAPARRRGFHENKLGPTERIRLLDPDWSKANFPGLL